MHIKDNSFKIFYSFILNNSLISSASIIANVSIVYFLYFYTRSALDVSIVAIITSIFTIIVSLPSGVFIDHLNRGLLLSLSGFLGGVAFIIFAFYIKIVGFNLYLLITVAVFRIIAMDIFRSTNNSILPDITSSLAKNNGINHSLMYGIRSVSSIIAGIIILYSIFFAFLYSSLTYFSAGLISFLIIYPFIKNKKLSNSKKKIKIFSGIIDGFRYIVKEKGLFELTLLSAFLNLSFGITFTYLVVYIISGIHGNSLIYGMVLGVYPLGYVIGSLSGKYINLKYTGKIWILHGILSGISFIIMGIFPGDLTVIVFYIIIGISVGFSNNIWLTSSQNTVPEHMRGRYFATDNFFTSIFNPLSIVLGILLILFYGIIQTFIISGIIMVFFSLIFLFMKNTFNFNGNKKSDNRETIL